MRSHIITSGLAIALAFSGVIAPVVGQPIDRTIAQVDKTSEIDRAKWSCKINYIFLSESFEHFFDICGQFI